MSEPTEIRPAELYDIHIRIDKTRMQILLTLLDSVTILSMTPVMDEPPPPPPKRKHHRQVARGLRGIDLAMSWIANRGQDTIHLFELRRFFASKGFSEDTPSPILSKLCRTGLLKQQARGTYTITTKFWEDYKTYHSQHSLAVVANTEVKNSA